MNKENFLEEKKYTEKNITRAELIKQARKSFNNPSFSGFSLFQFHEPQLSQEEPVGKNREEAPNKNEGEFFADTLKPRIVISTVLFLALFLLLQFEAVPWLNQHLPELIADNRMVEDIYDKASLWLAHLR